MNSNSLVILDCTLRDGGYYNAWDFDKEIVNKYLQAISSAGINAIEIGFRNPPKNKFLGAFAYCREHFLSQLKLPTNCRIAVMIDSKDFGADSNNAITKIDELFCRKTDSVVDIVRICSQLEGIQSAESLSKRLKELGYLLCFNIMQIAGKTQQQIAQAIEQITSWQSIDVLYFADSLGSMDTSDVNSIIQIIRDNWDGPLGIHAHDNKGQALANTMAAIDSGINWADGTILGMGRGAGNACTEHILVELNKRGTETYEPEALFTIVMEDFQKLRQKYGWGYNILYYLSASYGIHPTYVQEMIGSLHYDTHQMLAGLKTLKNWGANAYSQDKLREAMIGQVQAIQGQWSADNWIRGRNVLVIGQGPGVKKHLEGLIDYIKRYKPFVICLNSNTEVANEFIDAYAVCHHTRLLTELEQYAIFCKPVLMPFGILPESVRKKISNLKVLDYGINVEQGKFEIKNNHCTIPGLLVAAYVFAAATRGGAKQILLAGFDGYGSNDPRQEEMIEVINCYKKSEGNVSLIAITPSTYGIEQSSVYL